MAPFTSALQTIATMQMNISRNVNSLVERKQSQEGIKPTGSELEAARTNSVQKTAREPASVGGDYSTKQDKVPLYEFSLRYGKVILSQSEIDDIVRGHVQDNLFEQGSLVFLPYGDPYLF